MAYSIVATRTVALSNGIQTIIGLTNPDLMISLIASDPVTGSPTIERIFKEGNVFRVRWVQGEKKGGLIPLSYGDRELILDIPDTSQPFNLELMPSRLQFSYTVQVFTRDLTEAQVNLASLLNLPVSALNGINNQLIEILARINNMAASDIRNVFNAINQTSDGMEGIRSASLTQEKFELFDENFILTGSVYRAVVTMLTVDGNQGVGVSVTDAEGDTQLCQTVVGYDGATQDIAVELDASAWNSNSYPLYLLCQGKPLAI